MRGFTTFHELALLRFPEAPHGLAPASPTVPARVTAMPSPGLPSPLFPQPRHARWWKWWAVEVRFDRPLVRREVRVLTDVFGGWRMGEFGRDGAVWSQWWNSFPGPGDAWLLLDAMRRVDVPGVVRAAPFGRDCPGGAWPACPLSYADDSGHRCVVGADGSPAPVFRPEDWIAVDFR